MVQETRRKHERGKLYRSQQGRSDWQKTFTKSKQRPVFEGGFEVKVTGLMWNNGVGYFRVVQILICLKKWNVYEGKDTE